MGVSTVKLNGTTLMTVNDTTATASDVASGKYFYGVDGEKTAGTSSGGGGQAAAFFKALCENTEDLLNYTELPVNPTSIGAFEFYDKAYLGLTSLPDSVTSIGNYAFTACMSAFGDPWTIPSGVTVISEGAFYLCYAMTDVTIPSGVTNIGAEAFSYCNWMTAYHLKPTTPPTLADVNAFENIPADCKIYVPGGCLNAYRTASNWSTYASHMEEE